ncbi:MAG: hypothetical protein H6721_34155 [Sandaracinus sp.]|nr:hypothetical protein [Sandaracinus sp.]
MRASPLFAVLLLLLAACGSKAPTTASGDPIPRPQDYEAPPAPCPLVEDAGPTLALPWRGGAQTFLEAGTVRDSLALDYDVWPRPHVDHVRWALDFDRIVSDEVVDLAGACPRAFDLAPVRTSLEALAPGDVARVVVFAEGDDRSRRGELFFTTGTRTLRVSSEGLPTDRASLLFFEPAWGEPRLALRVVEAGEEGPWALDGLPEGPGMLGWVALDEAPLHDADNDVVYLPGGFAQDWVSFARAFRARAVSRDEDAEVLTFDLGSDDFDPAENGDELVWDGTRDLVLVAADADNLELPMDLPDGISQESLPHLRVSVPCAPFELVKLSTSNVFVAFEGADEAPLLGGPATFQPACTEGTTEVAIRVQSSNGRDTRVLLRRVSR